eukprot:scaffold48665_cov18-Prasinocladus_malaysianus.AAC.3
MADMNLQGASFIALPCEVKLYVCAAGFGAMYSCHCYTMYVMQPKNHHTPNIAVLTVATVLWGATHSKLIFNANTITSG